MAELLFCSIKIVSMRLGEQGETGVLLAGHRDTRISSFSFLIVKIWQRESLQSSETTCSQRIL